VLGKETPQENDIIKILVLSEKDRRSYCRNKCRQTVCGLLCLPFG